MITRAISVLLLLIGVSLIIRTALEGVGGGLGFLLGALFVLVGALRLYGSRVG